MRRIIYIDKESRENVESVARAGSRDTFTQNDDGSEARSWLRRFERCYLGTASRREYEELGFTDEQRLERSRARDSFRRAIDKREAGDERQLPLHVVEESLSEDPIDALIEAIDLRDLSEVETGDEDADAA